MINGHSAKILAQFVSSDLTIPDDVATQQQKRIYFGDAEQFFDCLFFFFFLQFSGKRGEVIKS